jgi:hypothetical protein
MSATTRRGVTALAVITLAALLLSGCDNSPGTVTGSHTATLAGQTHYFLTIRHDRSGKETDEDVPVGTFVSCRSGDRWPECTR